MDYIEKPSIGDYSVLISASYCPRVLQSMVNFFQAYISHYDFEDCILASTGHHSSEGGVVRM